MPGAGSASPGDLPRGEPELSSEAMREVGKTALGGLALSTDGGELYVMNLHERRIYRYAMPGGTLLGSFDHGAAGQSWADAARPFALTYHASYLYHGVLNSTGSGPDFVALVYRSRPDGSDMTEVARLSLDYPRDAIRLRTVAGSDLNWEPWVDQIEQAPVSIPTSSSREIPFYPTPMPRPRYEPRLHVPQPMLTDLAFADDGTLVVALRDRFVDMQIQWVRAQRETTWRAQVDPARPTLTPEPGYVFAMAEEALGFGDLLRGQPTPGGTWGIQISPEHFDDKNDLDHSESAFGGVASVPGTTRLASTHAGIQQVSAAEILAEEGVYWYDLPGGGKVALESVGKPAGLVPYAQLLRSGLAWADNGEIIITLKRTTTLLREVGSLGDIEALCARPADLPTEPPSTEPPQSPSPSPTAPPATDTPSPAPTTATPPTTPTSTPTSPPPTIPLASPTPTRGPAYLPLLLREHCDPTRVRADVVLVLDASSSMTGAKLAAAKAAAAAFIRAMRLPDDQVGIVTFHTTATVISPLGGDRAALEAAIDGITVAAGTRIDTGIEAARTVLAGPERVADHTPVVVVLTDGIQAVEPERPLALADELRAAGVELYVVGLGLDVDAGYLARLAGEPGRLFVSPTPDALAAVYERIARSIPCGAAGYWGGR